MSDITLSEFQRQLANGRWSKLTVDERRKATEPARKALAAKRQATKQDATAKGAENG